MTSLVYLDKFYSDLEEIWSTIAVHDSVAARRMIDKLVARCFILEDHPFAGQSRTDIHPECRHLSEGNYVILYRVTEDKTEVRRVYWAGRNIQADMF